MDAVPYHFPECVLAYGFIGCICSGFKARDFNGHAARRGQKKMSRPARGVYNLELQDGIARVLGVVGNGLGENRFERRLDQFAYEGRGSIVGPRQLSLGTSCPFAVFISDKPKSPRHGINVHFRPKLQQTFIHGTELFGAHVSVVDTGERFFRPEETQIADGFQKPFVRDCRLVQIGALVGIEKAAQSWKTQSGLSLSDGAERDLKVLPEILVVVVMTSQQGTFTQAGKRITLCEYRSLRVCGIGRVKQVSLLNGEKKEHSVYESEHLLKIPLRREIAVSDGCPQVVVVPVFQKTVADLSQGFGDSVAEILPCAFARFMGLGPPGFHDAARRFVVGGLKTA